MAAHKPPTERTMNEDSPWRNANRESFTIREDKIAGGRGANHRKKSAKAYDNYAKFARRMGY